MGIFSKNPLERIEKKDERNAAHLEKFVERIAHSFKEFKRILHLNDINAREVAIDELRDELEEVLKAILQLIEDERSIELVEMSDQKYATTRDDDLLKDKTLQLTRVKDGVQSLIDIIDENPNLSEYTQDLLETVKTDITEVETSFERIVEDDEQLKAIYKSMN